MADADILVKTEKIKTALLRCADGKCWGCPCGGGTEEDYAACQRLGSDAVALITAQAARIKELTKTVAALTTEADDAMIALEQMADAADSYVELGPYQDDKAGLALANKIQALRVEWLKKGRSDR